MAQAIGDFCYTTCPAWIQQHYGSNLRLNELKAIISGCFILLKRRGTQLPRPSRNTKRSMALLVKYTQDHLNEIEPIIPCITLCDKNKQEIPLLEALKYQKDYESEQVADGGVDSNVAPQ